MAVAILLQVLLVRFAGNTLRYSNALLTLTALTMSKLVFSFLLSHILKTVLILIVREDMISTDLFFIEKKTVIILVTFE